MKLVTKAVLAAVLVLTEVSANRPALANNTSIDLGFGFGFPGYWYPAPYYYPPAYPYFDPYFPPYNYSDAPTTYIERAAPPAPAQSPAQWWYYCVDAGTYYPYVRECAGGWQRVSPTPPGS